MGLDQKIVRQLDHHFYFTFIVLFGSGCATPVGVTRVDEQAAHRELNANVLSTGKPSDYSTQVLERSALSERFKSDPQTVLADLNSGLGKPDEHDRLFALSELSFAYAEDSGNQSLCLPAGKAVDSNQRYRFGVLTIINHGHKRT